MIFKQYAVKEDGSFNLKCSTRYVNGFENMLDEADSFFKANKADYFPLVEIEQIDNLDLNSETCLRQMFMMKQIEFFLRKGWEVLLTNLDDKKSTFTGPSESTEKDVNEIASLLFSSRKNFWVAGFFPKKLWVCMSSKAVRMGAILNR